MQFLWVFIGATVGETPITDSLSWILSRATLNHPYHRFALLDLLQSLFDVRPPAPCSGFPPTMAKKVLEMISRRLVLPIEFVRLHFCFSETRAIKGHSTNSAR